MSKWTAERVAEAMAALRDSATILEASQKLGLRSPQVLRQGLHGVGKRASDYLRAPEAKPPSPTDIAAARTRAAQRATDADVRQLQQRIIELEDKLAFVHSAAAHAPVILTPSARPKSGKRIADPVFMISDTHYGEVVTRAGTLGLNEYNLEIARARQAKCWDNFLWLRRDMARTQSCDNTYLAINGDIVTGIIHPELRETNEVGMRGQCDFAVEVLAPGILAMADATPGVLHIGLIGGNHGRGTLKQQVKNGTEHSYEHIGVYDQLRRLIGDRRGKIAWHCPAAERLMMVIHGRRVSQQHGTMIRSSGGIGGPLVPMTRWVTRDAMADLYLFGHFHEADAYGRVIKNGSLIGDSDYSRWLGVDPNVPPAQVAFVIDADAGVRRFERVSVT